MKAETVTPEAPQTTIPTGKPVEDERKPARGITKRPYNEKRAKQARKAAKRSRKINRGQK
jgi:hypothetical protein